MVPETGSEIYQQRVTTENMVEPSWWSDLMEDLPDKILWLLRGAVIVILIIMMIPYLAVSWGMVWQRFQFGLLPIDGFKIPTMDLFWGMVQTLSLAWMMNRVFIQEYTVEDYHRVRQEFFLKHRYEDKRWFYQLLFLSHKLLHKLEIFISWPARMWREENDLDHNVVLLVERILQLIILTPLILIFVGQVADLYPAFSEWWNYYQPIWADDVNRWYEGVQQQFPRLPTFK